QRPAGMDVRVEAFGLALLLRFPALREAGEAFDPALFRDEAHRQIFDAWRRADTLLDDLPDVLRDVYARLMELRLPPYDHAAAQEALLDVAQKLRLRALVDEKRLVNAEVRE